MDRILEAAGIIATARRNKAALRTLPREAVPRNEAEGYQVQRAVHDLLLPQMGALVGESDHGVSKSLYAKDPDGNEFEVMWAVPREEWGALEHEAITKRLDLAREVAQRG